MVGRSNKSTQTVGLIKIHQLKKLEFMSIILILIQASKHSCDRDISLKVTAVPMPLVHANANNLKQC